jgi:hypothetical protein
VREVYKSVKENENRFEDKNELKDILYLLYFSLSANSYKYGIKYLFDKNILFFNKGLKRCLYLLVHPMYRDRWERYSVAFENVHSGS